MKQPVITVRGVPIVLILGVAMIVAGIYYVYLNSLSFAPEHKPIMIEISYVVIACFGIRLVMSRDMDSRRGVYLCGIALGIASILQNVFFMEDESMGTDFFLGFFGVLLGIAEITFSAVYLFGFRNVVLKLLILIGIQVLMTVIPIFLQWYSEKPTLEIVKDYMSTFPMLFIQVVYAWILLQKGIWVPFPTGRIARNLDDLEDMLHADSRVYMTPADLDLLLDRSRWTVMPTGPVDTEVSVFLRGVDRNLTLTVQTMEGDPVPHASVLPADPRQFIQGFRFDMVYTVVAGDRGSVRFYGHGGVFVNILVKEPPEPRKGFGPFRRSE